MKKVCLLLLFFGHTVFATPQKDTSTEHKVKGLVVMLPGLFNRFLPDSPMAHNPKYNSTQVSKAFSQLIVDNLMTANLDVYAFEPFNWRVSVEDISSYVANELLSYYNKNYPNHDVPVYFVGHSAGGFVALRVTQMLAAEVPVRRIITLGTPYNGSPMANYLSVGTSLLPLLDDLTGDNFDLTGISYVTTRYAHEFLSHITLPKDVTVVAYAGYQPKNAYLFPSDDPRYLSAIFVPFQLYMPEYSDGVVDVASALGYPNTMIRNSEGFMMQVRAEREQIIPLDHAELIVDERSLQKIVPTANSSYIRDQQQKFISLLIEKDLE